MSMPSQSDRCLVYSQDHQLRTRLDGCLRDQAAVAAFGRMVDLSAALEQFSPAVVMVDALAGDAREVLVEIIESYPLCLAILLGEERSDPVLEAEGLGVFAIESPECPRKRLQGLYRMARRHLHVLVDRQRLQNRVAAEDARGREGMNLAEGRNIAPAPFGMTDDLDELVRRSLHWMRECHGLGSVSLFLKEGEEGALTYRSKLGLRCPSELSTLVFEESDQLVQWLRLRPSVVDRQRLPEIGAQHHRAGDALERGLSEMLAEAVIPVFGNSDFLGWLAIGRGVDGSLLPASELARISQSADCLGSALERCILHNRIENQRQFFEAILDALSIGVIMVDGNSRISWINRAAAGVCEVLRDEIIGATVTRLGSRLASILRIPDETSAGIARSLWAPPRSSSEYVVEVHPSDARNPGRGVFAILQEVEPSGDWGPDGGSEVRPVIETHNSTVSTEIRGPLVAIKTFVQLLPERYREQNFREKLVNVVSQEVERLHELSKCLEGLTLPEGREPWHATEAGEILRLAMDDACVAGNFTETEIYISGESGILLRLESPDNLKEVLSELLHLMITGPMASDRPRIWVETYLEQDETTGSACIFSFRGEGAAKLDSRSRGKPEFPSPMRDSLKTKIANLDGKVNFGYNKKRSYVTLQLPTNRFEQ